VIIPKKPLYGARLTWVHRTDTFYHWRHRLELESGKRQAKPSAGSEFLLVQPAPKAQPEPATGSESAVLVLALDSGWRLRIPRGVDEATLRAVLAALR
jgi:hypothetical protein